MTGTKPAAETPGHGPLARDPVGGRRGGPEAGP